MVSVNDIIDKKWEYCEVHLLRRWGEHLDRDVETWVEFYGDGDLRREWQSNQWKPLMRALGTAEWELVSVTQAASHENRVRTYRQTAYLKRPVRRGRAVNAPPLAVSRAGSAEKHGQTASAS